MAIIVAATYAATIPNPPLERNAADEALPVQAIKLRPVQSIERRREFAGTLKAARRANLAFERSARLMQVLVDEGERIESGQTLAVLDHRQLQAQIRQTDATINQQTAILTELLNGPRKELIAATKAEWQAATADVSLRKATLGRIQDLHQRNSSSAQQLDEARLAYESAAAKQESAHKRFQELEKGTRQEQINAQTASIDSLKAEKDRLEISLKDSTLTAPFSGTITKRFADEGNMLSPGQAILELVESDHMEAHVGVPTQFVGNLAKGESLLLSTDQIEVYGVLKQVVRQVDSRTRTQTVILSVNESENYNLADGQLVRLHLDESVNVKGFLVPTTALASGNRGLWKAYIAEPNQDAPTVYTVQDRAVEVIHSDGNQTVIRGTVYPGEQLITHGVHRVVPGQTVRIVRPDQAKTPSNSPNQ